jgi:hypothetical protein
MLVELERHLRANPSSSRTILCQDPTIFYGGCVNLWIAGLVRFAELLKFRTSHTPYSVHIQLPWLSIHKFLYSRCSSDHVTEN